MDMEKTGQFLAALRKSRGLTQQEVADRLGVSDKTVSKWECGNGLPDITGIPAIAELFEVTADEILRGERIIKEQTEQEWRKTEEQANYYIANVCRQIKARLSGICVSMVLILLAALYFMNKHSAPYVYLIMLACCGYDALIWALQSAAVNNLRRSGIARKYQAGIDRINNVVRLSRISLFCVLYVSALCLSLFLTLIGFGGITPALTWNQSFYHGLAAIVSVTGLLVNINFNKTIG